MCTLLYGNTSTLANILGGGNHRHIRIIIQDTLYTTTSPTPYDAPVGPVGTSTVPLQSTILQRYQLRDKHTEARCIHDNHHNTDAALKKIVINKLNNKYVFALHNVFTGCMGSFRKDIMNHLMARYMRITAADIEIKKKSLQQPLDTSQPISMLYKAINDIVHYTIEANILFTPAQVIIIVYHAINSSGIYTDACKDWRRKPRIEKTWVSFKTFIVLGYNNLRGKRRLNTTQAGFHNTNHAAEEQLDFDSALENLELADFSNKGVIAQLNASNKTSTESNKTLTATISSLTQHGIWKMGQTTQEIEECMRNEYEYKLDSRVYY